MTGRALTRVPPALPAGDYRTYLIVRPPATHERAATCEQVACQAHLQGWETAVNESTDLGVAQAAYVRTQARRAFTEDRDGVLTRFTFAPGQRCFTAHTAPVDRPPVFGVRDGDHRGNPRGTPTRVHASGDDWVDDFAGHQDRLARTIEKG